MADGDRELAVTVVIVSYNTRDVTRRCLESVFEKSRDFAFEVILVDNASGDQSAEMVASEFPAVRLIANSDNRGFAAGNNQALEIASGRFVLLLNPDTELSDNAILTTLQFMEQRPDAGVVGCRVMLPDGRQQSTIFRYLRFGDVALNLILPTRLVRRHPILGRARYSGADLSQVIDVEVVAGCFMLVRREVIESVGGMDEDFFMYGEEAEWCYRIRRQGWRVLYYPDATILHHSGLSAIQAPERMTLNMAKGQILLIQKTQGRVAAYVANFLMLVRDLPRSAAWMLFSIFPESKLSRLLRPAATRFGFHARGLLSFDFRDHA